MLQEDIALTKHFTIRVDYKPLTDTYSVDCTDSGFEAEAPSLCEALHKLANDYEAHLRYGSDKYDPNVTTTGARTKKCSYCSGRIFFAETRLGKWMPIDAESVPSIMLGSTRGYLLTPVNGGTRAPLAQRITQRYHGQTWIAHQSVCGSGPTPPDSDYLKLRWEKNRGITVQATQDAADDLQRMVSELAPEAKAA